MPGDVVVAGLLLRVRHGHGIRRAVGYMRGRTVTNYIMDRFWRVWWIIICLF